MAEEEIPYIRKMTGNWLTKKINPDAYPMALVFLLLLALASFLYWTNEKVAEQILASGQSVFIQKEYWRLWTTLFAHADVGHLLANSLLFGIFGYFLMAHFGFWAFPFSAIFFGGVTNFLVLLSLNPKTDLLGASGIVFWMGGAWITLHFFIERRGPLWKRIFRALGVAIVLFVPQTIEPQVSYLSHFIGFCSGVFWALIYYFIRRKEFLKKEKWKTFVDPTYLIATSLAHKESPGPLEYWKESPPQSESDT